MTGVESIAAERREQIDAWVALRDTLKGLCEDFDPDLF